MVDQEKIMEIAKQLQGLSPEDQQKKFQEMMQDYSPEEQKEIIDKLSGGNQECPFCSMIEGKIPTHKVYEDDKILGILDINPANKGHILLFPKKHASILSQLDEEIVGNLFKIANKLSEIVFGIVNAEGTNIVVANGAAAGQRAPHVLVNIIPRFKDDKVSIGWGGEKGEEKELQELSVAIRDKASGIAVEEQTIEDISDDVELPKEETRIP